MKDIIYTTLKVQVAQFFFRINVQAKTRESKPLPPALLLHHFFNTHGMEVSHVHFHADNCCGQNKNLHVIAYYTWRVLTDLHTEIKFLFLIVINTKFFPVRLFWASQTQIKTHKSWVPTRYFHCNNTFLHRKPPTTSWNTRWY